MADAKKVKKPELELSTGTGETIGSLATEKGIRDAKYFKRPDRVRGYEIGTHTGRRKHELEDRTRRDLGHDRSQAGASYKDIVKNTMGLGGKKGDYENIKSMRDTLARDKMPKKLTLKSGKR